MKYPILSTTSSSREWLEIFRGYDHNPRIPEGEFYEMTNMTSDGYPTLSPRPHRGTYATTGTPRGIISKDSLCYIDGGSLYINGTAVTGFALSDTDKTLISMGSYLIILPDKKYINITNTSDKGSIEASYTSTGTVSFEICDSVGSAFSSVTTSATEPEEPSNGAYWLDTSTVPNTLKQYSGTPGEWVTITNTYTKISALSIGADFSVGDGITISGATPEGLSAVNGSHIIKARADGYIVIGGILAQNATQTTSLTVSRKMPLMDFMTESENRLWGCRRGTDNNGDAVNEIYASKLGDFKNWNVFEGLASDSYAVSVGTDGVFTGAVTHLGYPIFFKENCLHKIYGSSPSSYQVQTVSCRGVEKGSSRSLATVNEVLYYKSRSGVCAYDGSLPSEISYALGDVVYCDAVAGALGNKYYISMKKKNTSDYSLFVYDTARQLWHREDDTRAVSFCNHEGDLLYIDYGDKYIKSVGGSGAPEPAFSWSVETGLIGTDSPDRKYVSRLDLRIMIDVGSTVSLFIEYDSSGEWEYLYTATGESLKSSSVPVRPRRCDHFRLKIIGHGEAKIYSICKTVEEGSDL